MRVSQGDAGSQGRPRERVELIFKAQKATRVTKMNPLS